MPNKSAGASPMAAEASAAFYPSRAPRSGPLGTFTKFPEYIEDPLEEKMKVAREAAKAARINSTPFKPTSKPKTSPSRTIIFHTKGLKP